MLFMGEETMEMIKKILNKIAYIFICINLDIKMRYQIQKEVEDEIRDDEKLSDFSTEIIYQKFEIDY